MLADAFVWGALPKLAATDIRAKAPPALTPAYCPTSRTTRPKVSLLAAATCAAAASASG